MWCADYQGILALDMREFLCIKNNVKSTPSLPHSNLDIHTFTSSFKPRACILLWVPEEARTDKKPAYYSGYLM